MVIYELVNNYNQSPIDLCTQAKADLRNQLIYVCLYPCKYKYEYIIANSQTSNTQIDAFLGSAIGHVLFTTEHIISWAVHGYSKSTTVELRIQGIKFLNMLL